MATDQYPWRVVVKKNAPDYAELVEAREGERLASPDWVTFWDAETEELVYDPRY